MFTAPPKISAPVTDAPLNRGQWMVLLAAMLGWLFDGYEIGLFPVVARPALQNILGAAGDGQIGWWMGVITACFLIGAALGGVLFGWLGDRIGRVRAMGLSILTYSLVTGLGYLADSGWHLGLVRGISALGMGGQWALGVALVMECWPEKWRPLLAGVMGAAANVGFLLVGVIAKLFPVTPESWRWMMLLAAAPALIVVFIMIFVPESERWKNARRAGSNPLREIFEPGLRRRTMIGIALASIALIGTWGSVQWLPLWADKLAGPLNPGAKAETQMFQAMGAIVGAFLAPMLGAWMGRRISYFLLCALSLVLCGLLFRTVHEFNAGFLAWAFVVSGVTASFYGWFPLFFPELFPTRVRATAQGLCYNAGRVLAAVGAMTQGQLVGYFGGSYAQAGAVVTLIYVAGMAVIWLAPETKGQPLPD